MLCSKLVVEGQGRLSSEYACLSCDNKCLHEFRGIYEKAKKKKVKMILKKKVKKRGPGK